MPVYLFTYGLLLQYLSKDRLSLDLKYTFSEQRLTCFQVGERGSIAGRQEASRISLLVRGNISTCNLTLFISSTNESPIFSSLCNRNLGQAALSSEQLGQVKDVPAYRRGFGTA